MTFQTIRYLAVIAIVLLILSGCAGHRTYPAQANFGDITCNRQWSALAGALAEQGIHDAQGEFLPDYPFLRVTRPLAAMDLMSLSVAQRQEWLALALDEGLRALTAESARLPDSSNVHLPANCAAERIAGIAQDDDEWANLASQAEVPDAYLEWRRYLGLFPLLRPIFAAQVNELEAEFAALFGRYEPEHDWHDYRPALDRDTDENIGRLLAGARDRSLLGFPQFTPDERQRLLRHHAPVLQVERGGGFDRVGTPRWRNERWQVRSPARAYTHITATRWQGEWLPQLVYVFWFDERPKSHAFDLYGGRIDGLTWRVTLNRAGDVLLYDSMHPCGCYLKWYPVAGRLALDESAVGSEIMNVFALELSEGPLPRTLVRLQSGTHYVVDVQHEPLAGRKSGAQTLYSLTDYDRLRALTDAQGTRSFFRADSLVPGSQRLERFLIWNTGVLSPGAMRQWGNHATAFIGQRHFDDPGLLERYFRPADPD
jgi:hypothetical protein